MRWRKLGLIYQPTSCPPWFSYGAITPTPIPSDDTTISFIVTRCDRNGVGRPASVTLDLKDPFDVRVVEDQSPLLDVGRAGMFDDNGVMACSVVSLPSGDQVMYYVGFELCTESDIVSLRVQQCVRGVKVSFFGCRRRPCSTDFPAKRFFEAVLVS